MPSKLSERPEELVRQFLVDNIRTAEIHGYDPQQTDTTATDFLPVTSDWSFRGDYYPIISVREDDGPTVPNSGETNYNGLAGDGSGPTQFTTYPINISVQAVQEGAYLNGVSAEDLVYDIYSECHTQIQTNAETAVSEAHFVGMTPPTVTRSTDEPDSGDTITWVQRAGTISMGVTNTP